MVNTRGGVSWKSMHERRYTGTVVMSTLYQCQDSVLTAVAKRKSISKPHAFYSTWSLLGILNSRDYAGYQESDNSLTTPDMEPWVETWIARVEV